MSHFNHKAILNHRTQFNSLGEMNKHIVDKWNSVVSKDDHVWVLGDFSWYPKHCRPILTILNGSVHLIRGNHDSKSCQWYEKQGFASCHDVYYMRYEKERFFLSHYAHRTWRKSHHGSYHLFGHSHGDLPRYNRSMDVGVDAWDFDPISIDTVMEYLKDDVETDHHDSLS